MIELCRGQVVTARLSGEVSHDRLVAVCSLPDGRDLAAELVRQDLALDWKVFSGGRYRALEPQDARRRLWYVGDGRRPEEQTPLGARKSAPSAPSARAGRAG